MVGKLAPAIAASSLLSFLILYTLALPSAPSSAQGPVRLAIDADPSGNTATSFGTVQRCVSVSQGETFQVDILVSDVEKLISWELYFTFDPQIVEVVDADPKMFLASAPGSSLTTLKVPLPRGRYFVGAADTKGTAESGSGVLARLTLRAKASGLSPADIPSLDVDGDGRVDMGPRLVAPGDTPIGDVTGDGAFDGEVLSAVIAVDQPCQGAAPGPDLPPAATPTPTPQPEPEDETPDQAMPPSEPSPAAGDVSPTPSPQEDQAPEATPAVLGSEATPSPGAPREDAPSGPADGLPEAPDIAPSGGGMPLWAVGLLTAAGLLMLAAAGVYLNGRRARP